ncbi:MAG TPA: hypothetical protein VGG20_15425 [Thermoanaerobaculia bacterium]
MPFEDFAGRGRIWTIQFSDSKTCLEKTQVRFSGSEDEVWVDCGGGVPFPIGKYNKGTNRIDLGGYEIRLQLVYVPKIPTPIGGSWTAEDTAGGVGGGGEKGD